MGRLEADTQEWLDSLELLPHQKPVATLALELAAGLDRKRTAAAAKEFRATIEALTPADARRHQVEENANAILAEDGEPGSPAPATTPPPAPALTPARRRALEVLLVGAAQDRPVFESNATTAADQMSVGNGRRLTIYWQSRKWLTEQGYIAAGDLASQWELTAAGKAAALGQEVR